ncbi:hypothetical protein VC83_06653 [Pseudogymnoascus destructans]|uniref:Uncharacterized protein n=2 Tax=Pseudogymnoascus destructans TaxID=655981 RepID=L8FZE1_PSED2|nr:uncharacterized protein VC83_06653 [Pseudogymnoascus destructans]ELR05899.1 hypothetical protein GMDG_07672 [Pseudogymnoascus destructans 20631-21]OAF56350.1 hypothetical protein VC83_06653 [Pseudogymnoascus destructans]
MDPLNNLVKSIPDWQVLLDDLNGKIARRQGELAEAENSRPSTRSLRNKGSTESLRPKDDNDVIPEDIEIAMNSTTDTPNTNNDTTDKAPSPPNVDNSPRTPQHNTSNRLRGAFAKGLPALTPPVLRKRKTESLASAELGKPKHRTRCMIIVYYDSAVQSDFEALVKHISASRNSMRKGKMAARMASMRMMADLEALGDELEPELEVDKTPAAAAGDIINGPTSSPNAMMASASPGDEDDEGLPLPALKFVSTRRMGPMRELSSNKALRAGPGAPGVRRAGQGPPGGGASSRVSALGSSIFDELDSGLEWCQSMCEHAAHQFLRDGQCTSEIEGIKSRLQEVWDRAGEEMKAEGKGAEVGTDKDSSETTDRKADYVRAGDKGGAAAPTASATLKPEPQLPRTSKQIQIRREAEKMFEKPEKPAQKPAQKSLEKTTENSPKGLEVKCVEKDGGSAIKVDDVLEVDDDAMEADDDVVDEDVYRREYAAVIARNSNYRRRPSVR